MSNRLIATLSLLLGTVLLPVVSSAATAPARPNILWLTSEDNSPYLGCYGDSQARTPNLDKLATQGVRYRHAFANAPVCSAARSTLITGMHASSLGIHNHRSSHAIPASFPLYPTLLRQAGYYCTNNSKTDYNLRVKGKRGTTACWDQSNAKAHYKNRTPGQPFFAVFNCTLSHEGQTTDGATNRRRRQGLLPAQRIVPPAQVTLPPYHADTPVIRENWSRYYDNMWLMDQWAGDMLAELERLGLAEDTIVFYYSDHGGALPRGKRNLHDTGTRVPLIIRFPEKWRHLAPAAPGQWCDQIVSFVDLPATLFSITGIPIPTNYEGKAFLGEQAQNQDHVYLWRGRMDERYDTGRAVRSPEYLYINNFTPHRPWGQQYFYPFEVMPSMQSWYDAFQAGKCNAAQARYWQQKPGEEFYVIAEDPYQLENRIGEREQAATIARLRMSLRRCAIETCDIGFIPEGMSRWLPGKQTLYDYAHSDAYPIAAIYDLAVKATSRDIRQLSDLCAALTHAHPVMRYWAATGCLILGDKAAPAQKALAPLLADSAADNRVVAAEALAHIGDSDAALSALREVIEEGNEFEVLAALNSLEMLARDHIITVDAIHTLLRGMTFKGLHQRVIEGIETIDMRQRPEPPVVKGPRRVWDTFSVHFLGPTAHELDNQPNPFLDYRLQVVFTGPSGQTYDVPGFFNGDGQGRGTGHLWCVRFTPDQAGLWHFKTSFRSGDGIALSLDPQAGSPLVGDGAQGQVHIAPHDAQAPGFHRWGRLQYNGTHYLKFADGPYWIRGGTDSPENFLAYAGFDDTPPSHTYGDHVSDWRAGDPDWNGGKGRGIIGALNYLAAQHVNSIYFLVHNIGGDGKDVWPWAGSPNPKGHPENDNLHYDISKLIQWETVLSHAQRRGLFLHFVFNEAEAANKRELDNGELGPERKLYYREIVARFGHHLALAWNLCEEYNIGYDLGAKRIGVFADYIGKVDPYDHPITVHSAGDPVKELAFTFGDSRFSLTSIQLNQRPIHEVTEAIRSATRAAGRPLPVSLDEFTVDHGQKSWMPVDDPERLRKEKLWPTLFSGGMIEFILADLLQTDSFKTPAREALWRYTWFARKFMEEHLPFWDMHPADALVQSVVCYQVGIGQGKTVPLHPQVLAKTGEVYAVYIPCAAASGTLTLSQVQGDFTLQWYNPRTGVFQGDTVDVKAGAPLDWGSPPDEPDADWVLLVKRVIP